MTLKFGKSWWNRLDANQQKAMFRQCELSVKKYGRYEVNDYRKFLTAAKKKFGDSIQEYNVNESVQVDGKTWHYNSDYNCFSNFN